MLSSPNHRGAHQSQPFRFSKGIQGLLISSRSLNTCILTFQTQSPRPLCPFTPITRTSTLELKPAVYARQVIDICFLCVKTVSSGFASLTAFGRGGGGTPQSEVPLPGSRSAPKTPQKRGGGRGFPRRTDHFEAEMPRPKMCRCLRQYQQNFPSVPSPATLGNQVWPRPIKVGGLGRATSGNAGSPPAPAATPRLKQFDCRLPFKRAIFIENERPLAPPTHSL